MEKKDTVQLKTNRQEDKVKQTSVNNLDNAKINNGKPASLKKVTVKKATFRGLISIALFDLFCIAAIFVIILNIPKKAGELKKVRNDQFNQQAKSKVDVSGLDVKSNIETYQALAAVIPDENGLVNFIKEIEKLKEGGVVRGISFVSEVAVRDKTGNYGIPFIIDMQGSWEQIDTNLQEVQKLPYLTRTITIDVKVDDKKVVDFKYGGFIYVDESLAKS